MAQTRPDEKTESFSVKPGECVDERVPTHAERVALLRRIMKDGMANDLAKEFANMKWMSDDQRQGMVAHMGEDKQFLVHLLKVLDDDGITKENGKIGRAAGAEEGGKVGLYSGAALTVYGSCLFMTPAVPVVAAAVVAGGILGYCGGHHLGGRVGERAGQLCRSPEEARKEGGRQGQQAVRLVGATGSATLTDVALLRELLKRFCEVMHMLKTESPEVVLQLTNLHEKWTDASTDAETKKELKKDATDAIALALKPFKMEALAPLLVTLSFFFIEQIFKKSSSQTDVPHARV